MDIRGTNGPQWVAPTAGNYFNPFAGGICAAPTSARSPSVHVSRTTDKRQSRLTRRLVQLFGRIRVLGNRLLFLNSRHDHRQNYINLFNLRNAVGPSFRDATGLHWCTVGNGSCNCVPFNMFGGRTSPPAPADRAPNTTRWSTTSVTPKNEMQENTTKDYFANLSGTCFDMPAGAFWLRARHGSPPQSRTSTPRRAGRRWRLGQLPASPPRAI